MQVDALFGGHVPPVRRLGDWEVSWESLDDHRFWCLLRQPDAQGMVLVVMLNPGSLSGEGENLGKDKTLEILRETFANTGRNVLVVNLFSLASPDPEHLFDNWSRRLHEKFDYKKLPLASCSHVIYAYGNFEFDGEYGPDIRARIASVRRELSAIAEIDVKRNANGTPKHPRRWRLEKLTDQVRRAVMSGPMA